MSERLHRATVLIVDDDISARILLRESLEGEGFDVLEAEDGLQALQTFGAQFVDLILLDIQMPKVDGFDVCRRIRQMPSGRHVPVVMLTGDDNPVSIQRAYDVGATDFVTKPIHYFVLTQRVRYMLRAKRTADELRRHEAQLRNAHRIARLCYWDWRLAEDEFRFSDGLDRILGASVTIPHSTESYLGLVHTDDRRAVDEQLMQAVERGRGCTREFRLVAPSGIERYVSQEIEVHLDAQGYPTRISGTLQDVTDRRTVEERIRHLAYFDTVTGLPNRAFLKELLSSSLDRARSSGGMLGVLFLDVDRFKRINDTLGHDAGDTLLREVASRLRNCLRSGDLIEQRLPVPNTAYTDIGNTVSRLGGDEFVILLPDLESSSDARAVAERILQALARPVQLSNTEVVVSASIGISICPDDGETVDALLKNADAAMYTAKDAGRANYEFYREVIHDRAMERFSIETNLRRALENNELTVSFQPKISLSTGKLTGMEALARWDLPNGETVSPSRFVPVAEETGLIVPLGAFVLREAIREATRLHTAGLTDINVSVNLSAAQVRDGALVDLIRSLLHETDFKPERLEMELTESLLMENVDMAISLMRKLVGMGITVSVDDFGTGYSSLAYLNRFPLSALKIDRSFVADATESSDGAVIVQATIALAHSLGLRVVAEGVETESQLAFLKGQGCDEAQGYLFAKPMTADNFLAWALRRRAAAEKIAR